MLFAQESAPRKTTLGGAYDGGEPPPAASLKLQKWGAFWDQRKRRGGQNFRGMHEAIFAILR